MNEYADLSIPGFGNSVLPCQFNDMVRRSSRLGGEHRLLWAVLEDAIRVYLTSMKCATRNQRIAFEEVRRWFTAAPGTEKGLFGFQTVCELLGIEASSLVAGLKSLRAADLPVRRQHCVPRGSRMRSLAA